MAAQDDFQQLHAIVHGRVQGVNFRWYTLHESRALGLTGWVQNIPGSRVEVVAEGPRRQLENLAEFLQQGPPAARVTGVDMEWLPATHTFSEFFIRGIDE